MTKHLVCESSYRLQMVKNKAIDNKVVFVFKTGKTTLVVDDKHDSFVIDKSLSAVYEQVIDHFSLFRSDACSVSPVAAIFCPVYTCALKASFKTSSQCTGYQQLNTSCVETHFLALIVVDSIKLLTENSHRKQLASSVGERKNNTLYNLQQ